MKNNLIIAITPYGKRHISKCPNECNRLQQNGHCNQMCNTIECLYDGGDCDQIRPIYQQPTGAEAYHQSVNFVNYLLNAKYKLVFCRPKIVKLGKMCREVPWSAKSENPIVKSNGITPLSRTY